MWVRPFCMVKATWPELRKLSMSKSAVSDHPSKHRATGRIVALLPDEAPFPAPVAVRLAPDARPSQLEEAVAAHADIDLVVAPISTFDTADALASLERVINAGRTLRLLLLVGHDELDQVGASLGWPWVDYALIEAALPAARLVSVLAEDAPSLAELGAEAAEIAHALAKLAARLPLAAVKSSTVELDAAWVRRIIRLRRHRERFFPGRAVRRPGVGHHTRPHGGAIGGLWYAGVEPLPRGRRAHDDRTPLNPRNDAGWLLGPRAG